MKCYRDYGSAGTACPQCPLAHSCQGISLSLSFFAAPQAAPAKPVITGLDALSADIRASKGVRVWVSGGVVEAHTARVLPEGLALAYAAGDALRVAGIDRAAIFEGRVNGEPALIKGMCVALVTNNCRYGAGSCKAGDIGFVAEARAGGNGLEYVIDFPARHSGWRGVAGELLPVFPPRGERDRGELMNYLS